MLVKYNSSGVLQWYVRYDGTSNSNDEIMAMETDANGNIYVTGGAGTAESGNVDYTTIKYNSNGQQQWIATYNGPGNSNDYANSLAVDAVGNVYVTGRSNNSVNNDYATIKYNANGQQQWAAVFNGAANQNDNTQKVALDNVGNVFVTGRSVNINGDGDVVTIKYNNSGTQQWQSVYASAGNENEISTNLYVYNNEDIFVAGGIGGVSGRYLTIRYDAMTGTQKWAQEFDSGIPYNENASFFPTKSFIVDNTGNSFFTGNVFSSTSQSDLVTVKYDPQGQMQWANVYDGSGNGADAGFGIALSPENEVYVTGFSHNGTNYDFLTIKYGQCAQCTVSISYTVPKFTNGYNVSANGASDGSIDITASGGTTPYSYLWNDGSKDEDRQNLKAGIYYVTFTDSNGCTVNEKIILTEPPPSVPPPLGNICEKWVQRFNGADSLQDIGTAIDFHGHVYVGGSTRSLATGNDFVILKYDTIGNLLWSKILDRSGNEGNDYLKDIKVDGNCSVYVLGQDYNSQTQSDIVILKLDSMGNIIWENTFDGAANQGDYPISIALDNDLNTYITGLTYNSDGTSDIVTLKYDISGNELWKSLYNAPENQNDIPSKLSIDNNGNIYITGRSDKSDGFSVIITIKYDILGYKLWEQRFEVPNMTYYPSDQVVDNDNNIYVVGTGNWNNLVLIKYNDIGVFQWVDSSNYGISPSIDGLAVDGKNNIYLKGFFQGSTGSGLSLLKYDGSGNKIWSATRPEVYPHSLTVDEEGNSYLAGEIQKFGYFTIKYNTNGVAEWEITFNGLEGKNYAHKIALDKSNNVYVTGGSTGSGPYPDIVTIKYSECPPCTLTLSDTISQYPNGHNVSAKGANDGSIDLTVSGGTTPYTYIWNDGSIDEDRQNLMAGKYEVTITDDAGCIKSQLFLLTQPTYSLTGSGLNNFGAFVTVKENTSVNVNGNVRIESNGIINNNGNLRLTGDWINHLPSDNIQTPAPPTVPAPAPAPAPALSQPIAVGEKGTVLTRSKTDTTLIEFSTGNITDLKAVSAPSAAMAYAAGDSGTVIKSTDGGETWSSLSCGTMNDLQGMDFINDSTGIIVGKNAEIRTTSDSGLTWTARIAPIDSNLALNDVHYVDSNKIFAVGDSGTIIRSVDGGVTWEEIFSPVTYALYSIKFANADTGYAVGQSGTMLLTTDGGNTWEIKQCGTTETLNAICCCSADACAVGTNGVIVSSKDGGQTWEAKTSATAVSLNTISYAAEKTGYIAGDDGTMLKTTDGGDTWVEQPVSSSKDYYAIAQMAESIGGLTGKGMVELSGENEQKIGGLKGTSFYDLELTVGKRKKIDGAVSINNFLNLNSAALSLGDNNLIIENSDINAIIRNDGKILSLGAGSVVRKTASKENYEFPMQFSDGDVFNVSISPGNENQKLFYVRGNNDSLLLSFRYLSSIIAEKSYSSETGAVETVHCSIKKNGGTEIKFKFDIGSDLNISSLSAFDEKNEKYVPLSNGLFSLGNNSILIFSLSSFLEAFQAFSTCTGDNSKNWVLSKTFDEQETLTGMSINYSDYLGRPIQSQVKDLHNNEILASQIIYDNLGRPVLTTLQAPINQTDFCFKDKFITDNISDNNYNCSHFDNPSTSANVEGEINNPIPVNPGNQGTLGWYYSNNNTLEPFVPASGFPYTRVEYDNNSNGRINRISIAGESHKMGSGHSSESYTMKAGTELYYVLGYENGWGISVDNSNLENYIYEGIDIGNPMLQVGYQAWKTVQIDPDGKEKIVFKDLNGNLIASCLSGKVNGANVNSKTVFTSIRKNSPFSYVDIHLADGCESSLKLGNTSSGIIYNILDLRTNKYVTFSGSIDFGGVEPNLPPGVYRIIEKNHAFAWSILIQYDVNYYDYSLYYYDRAGRLTKIVPPEGIDPAYELDIEVTGNKVCETFEVNPSLTPKWSFSSGSFNAAIPMNLPQAASEISQFTNLQVTIKKGDCNYVPNDAELRIIKPTTGENTVANGAVLRQAGGTELDLALSSSGNNEAVPLYAKPDGDTEVQTELCPTCTCSWAGTGQYSCVEPVLGGFDSPWEAWSFATSYCAKKHCDEALWGYQGYAVWHWGLPVNSYCITCFGENPGPQNNGIPYKARYEIYYDIFTESEYNTNPQEPGDIASGRKLFLYRHADGNVPLWTLEYVYDLGTAVVDYHQSFTNDQIILKISEIKEFTVTSEYDPLTAFEKGVVVQTDDYTYLPELEMSINAKIYDVGTGLPDHKMASTFQYNTLGWLLTSQSPDEGKSEFVYRKDGQLRFSQNANQAPENKFSYFNYDRLGRVVESGVFAPSSSFNTYFQNHNGLPSIPSGATSVLNVNVLEAIPPADYLVDANCSEQTFLMYDVPDANFPTTPSYLSNYKQTFMRGRISKTWNDKPATNKAWYSYDDQGSLNWYAIDVMDLGIKTMDYTYEKDLLVREDFQKYVTGENFAHRFFYDENQRPIKAETSNDGGTSWLEHIKYFYYRHGPLKRIELGENVQGIDYIYTINGWLKSINHSGIEETNSLCGNYNRDPGGDGSGSSNFAADIFGTTLDYFNDDYIRNGLFFESGVLEDQNYYNGNIKSLRWKTQSPLNNGKTQMYSFKYDKRDWLTEATFGTFSPPCVVVDDQGLPVFSLPSKTGTEDYKIWNIAYDRNGNLLSLNRNALEVPPQVDVIGSTITTRDMDQMTYHYNLVTGRRVDNKLSYVTDANDNAKPNAWQDIKNQSAGNYFYDLLGQQIYDASEDNFFEYNSDGLVSGIYKKLAGSGAPLKDASKPKVKFIYDEAGLRIKKQAFHQYSFQLTKETWYVGDAIYEKDVANGATTPALEELSLFGVNRIGIYNKTGNTYSYELKDHLGSIRATVSRTKNADGTANVLSASDHYPWGMQMPGKTINTYRFDYQGAFAEKDAETGLINFELRNWDGRLARWNTTDPYMQFHSPYLGMGNNPISMIDPDGGQADISCRGPAGPLKSSSFSGISFGIGVGLVAIGASVESGAKTSAAAQSKVAGMASGGPPRPWNSNPYIQSDQYWNGFLYDIGTTLEWIDYISNYPSGDDPNVKGGAGAVEWIGGVGPLKTAKGLWTLSKINASVIKEHNAWGKIYKSKSDGLWWSIDKLGHGGSKFKVFKETNKGLEWYRDADEFGNFIFKKHKGKKGTFIPWGELRKVK